MPRPTVFISYSHRDEDWKDRLVRQLRVLEREDLLEVWDDRRIRAGEDWRAEIEAAMARARVALLLVSADFLISPFVRSDEVPRLLERRATQGLVVIPVIVRPCDWQAVPWLAAMQLRPRDGRPLSAGDEHRGDEDLAALAAEVRELLEGSTGTKEPTATADLGPRGWPPPTLPAEPYPLLLPYDHPDLLAGRDRELEALRRRLAKRIPILGLYAASGAGKSSLLAAGLVPAMRAEGSPVAFDRHPHEAGLAERLIGNLLVGPGRERPELGGDPHAFVELLAKAKALAQAPPLLVLDQFEDVLLSDGKRARAELGVLLASTVRAHMELDEPPCRWLLAYREEFHGQVTTWLEDVLRDAREAGVEVDGLPFDLAGQERFHSWALPMLGAPPPGDDGVEEAVRAFLAAIEKPLALREDGTPRYPWRFADGGAERLARAFAQARQERRDAPLAPELQVVLAHLLDAAGEGHEGVIDVVVPEDPERLIAEALADHLRKVLKSSFRAGGEAAARAGRTRALLALRELADAHGRRGEGIGASRLAAAIGEDGEAIVARLAAPGARLIAAREDDEDPSGKRYVLSHDRMAEAVVQAVEDEGVGLVAVDRELLRLRKLVALNAELYRARAVRQATDLDRKQFRKVRDHAEALLWDDERKEWWRECRQRRTRERQRRAAWTAVAAVALAVTGWRIWEWAERKAKVDTLLVEVAAQPPTRALSALLELVELEAEATRIQEHLRRREKTNLMALFEVGPDETESAYSKRIKAVEVLLPSLRDGQREDLELMGVLAWALDDVVARQPSLAAAAADLRWKVLAPFDPPERPSPEEPEWRRIPGGTFTMGSPDGFGGSDEHPAHEVTVSPFHVLEREVTVGEFRRLWSQRSGDPREPVTGVTWYQAYAYAAWVGGRLPTEAEWEYAARAQCGFDYCDDKRNEIEIGDAAWYVENSGEKLHPPCEKKRNQFGLCDMYGNAWEWVVDWYDAYSAESVTDPWGPPRGEGRVIRGGGFSLTAYGTRAAYRDWRDPWDEIRFLGFRVVLPRPAEVGHR